MSSPVVLSKRLSAAIPFIRKNTVVADIGTDHAHLPIFLIENHIASKAVACDINPGPLEHARNNIKDHHLELEIQTFLTDGLQNVEKFMPKDIIIFGMGGELIVDILSHAPFTKEKDIRLILQPMTKISTLRQFLTENGYTILDETIVEDGNYYQVICAEYTGNIQNLTEVEQLIGPFNIRHLTPTTIAYIRHEIDVLQRVIDGKRKSNGATICNEVQLLNQLKHLIS